MAVAVEERDELRPFLYDDAVRNSVVIQRMFLNPEFSLAFADAAERPAAALALKPASTADDPHQFAIHATDGDAARRVLRAVPPGFCLFHTADEVSFAALRAAIDIRWWGEAILYRLDAADFHDEPTQEVVPLRVEWAERIAKIWDPDWDATGYVRSRIDKGPSAAILVGGEPVAWYLTHFETPEVVMLGFLHVLDEHRRKGHAKALSRALIRYALSVGKVPACHVYTDNAASIRLKEGLGFRRVCLQAWGDGVVKK